MSDSQLLKLILLKKIVSLKDMFHGINNITVITKQKQNKNKDAILVNTNEVS